MPPVFRAQLLDAELGGRAAADVLDGAVNALVDEYVIAALTGPHGLQGESLAPERLPTFGGGLRDIELVPWDLAQYRHLDDSIAFAGILAQQLHDRVPLSPRPVDQAPLRILESANMPAVLIEMGFLTNADQEKALAGADFQTAFVQAIYDSLLRFRDRLAGDRASSGARREAHVPVHDLGDGLCGGLVCVPAVEVLGG